MKIIKEEQIEEYACDKCGRSLEFGGNELKEGIAWWKSIWMTLFIGDITTGNAWFECERCNKRYLIEDYAHKTEKTTK